MKTVTVLSFMAFSFLLSVSAVSAQVDEFCSEFGATPSFDAPSTAVPYVFGRITLKGGVGNGTPKLTITLLDRDQARSRLTVEKRGNYCFRRSGGSGTLIVEVDGVEVARRSFATFGPAQQREDFEVQLQGQKLAPATISAAHPPNEKTRGLYEQLVEAEKRGDRIRSIEHLRAITKADERDFVAWARLGALLLDNRTVADAETAVRKALTLKPEFVPAWIVAGRIRLDGKQFEAAIEVFKHTVSIEPTSARAFQLLGESYLLARQGTLGAEALRKAISLDPIGMAESHLQLAHLYQLAGAKALAAQEYKQFLGKVPEHPDRKKFEKFIRENPE